MAYVFDDHINVLDVCNLSRIPLLMRDNPFYKLATKIKMNDNETENKEYLKELFWNSSLTNRCSKTSLSVLYGKDIKKLSGYKGSVIFSPWYHREPVPILNESMQDVFFKIFTDSQYLEMQYSKIRDLVISFDSNGYCPEKFPTRQFGASGYWLKHEDIKRFYIKSGNHRAAVFGSMFPNKPFPVVFETKEFCKQRDLINRSGDFLNTYSSGDVNFWPSVKSGFITSDDAIQIMESYVYE